MAQPTLWERVKGGSKTGFDKAWQGLDKLGGPVNKLSNKLGSEAFWPTTLDKESDKAARILKTFCKDGFYAEEEFVPQDGPKQKQKVVKKIPTNVIKNAKGLAIFTTMRSGLWVSGAGGSGILIARQEDGTWSPPSGILLHTAGLGFLVGIDIYDCVIVINTTEALQAFQRVRCTLGSEISVVAGPVGAGGVLDTELHKRRAPIFTYLKSRGFYAGVQIDGSIIIERTDENERFYGQKISVQEILAGKVRHPPYEVRRLLETVRSAQGDSDVDESMLPTEAPPGDYQLEDGHVFGIPDKEDPDPYGVLALEKEGMSIKEAGTQKRASWEAFSFHPAPTSPAHNVYERGTVEKQRSSSSRSSWRLSGNANDTKAGSNIRRSLPPPPPLPKRSSVQMSDMSTQTDEGDAAEGLNTAHSRSPSHAAGEVNHMQEVPENEALDDTREKTTPDSAHNANGYSTPPQTPPMEFVSHESEPQEPHIEEPLVHSVQTFKPAAATQVISKAKIVTVPKREPPKLPVRNPIRPGGPVVLDASPITSTADSVSVESKHDSAQEPSESKGDDVDAAEAKLEAVKFDDEDHEDDVAASDPWSKVEEARRKEQDTSEPS